MQKSTKHSLFLFFLVLTGFVSRAQNATPKDTASKLMANKDLQGITVSSKKPFVVISADKTTLNVAQSAIAAGSNVYDIIKKAPGIAEQGDALLLKGKSVKVLINGRPSNLSGEDLKNYLSSMPGTTVEKVELLPNPSSRYDAQGGSVINIVLAKSKTLGTNYTATIGAGTGKFIKANTGLDVNHRSKKINIYGSYNFVHSREYSSGNSTRYLADGSISSAEYGERDRNSNNYRVGLDYEISKRSTAGFLLNGYFNSRKREADNTALLHHNNNPEDSLSKVHTNSKVYLNGPTVNLFYKTKLDSKGRELALNADYMNFHKTWDDAFTNRYFNGKGLEYIQPSFISNSSPSNINVYAFTADYVQPSKKGKWEAGIKSSYTIADNAVNWQTNTGSGWVNDEGKTNRFIYKEWVNAGYLNYGTIIRKWDIQAGLRAELTHTSGNSVTLQQLHNNDYLNLFPNLSVQFNKNDNNQFGFSYRKSIYRYGFSYVNPFIVYQNRYAYSKGNPFIKPELSDNLELSYTFKQAYSVSLNYTHGRRSLGEVYLQGDSNVTISSYGNYKSSDIVYISLSANQPIGKHWTTSINPMAGYMTLNSSSDAITATANKNVLVTQVNWMNSFTFKKGWNAEMSLMYLSPFQYGSYKTKTLFSTDLGVSKTLLKGKGSLKLAVSDIFNTLAYNKDVDYAGVITTVRQKEESRFVNMVFRYKFGNSNVKGRTQRTSKLSDIQGRIK